MRKTLLLLLGLLLIGILSYFCFMDKSTVIKKDLITKTEAIYQKNGLEGIKVGIRGEGLKQTRTITLNGEVASENIKDKAEELALNIDGVMGVENNLVVSSSMALVNSSKTVETKTETKDRDTKEIVGVEDNSSINKEKDVNSIIDREVESNITTNSNTIKVEENTSNKSSTTEENISSIPNKGVNESNIITDSNIVVNNIKNDSIKEENTSSISNNKVESNITEDSNMVDNTIIKVEENISKKDNIKDDNLSSISNKRVESNISTDTNIVDNLKKDTIKIEKNNSKEIDTQIDEDKLARSTIIAMNIGNNLADENKSLVGSKKESNSKDSMIITDSSKDKNSKIKSDISKCQNKFKELLGDNKIHFAYNRATISPKSYSLLNKLIKAIKSCPDEVIVIEGHTDSDGNEAYNQRLSEKRANAVKRYLIKHGVSASRLEAVGYGEKRPIADNNTKEGKEKNRRIEFKIKGVK